MERAVTNVERTCGPTQLHVEAAIKYVKTDVATTVIEEIRFHQNILPLLSYGSSFCHIM